jgi:hypothetical protein
MGIDANAARVPSISTARTAAYRTVILADEKFLPGFHTIAGSVSRDPLNSERVDELRPGLLLGIVTATKKFAPSIIGVTVNAYADNDLVLDVSAATATEILRRVGTTGTVNLVGPPTANGTVASTAVAYTAINTTTGRLTVPDLNVAAVAGSWIVPNDGSQTIVTFVPNGYSLRVTDDNGDNIDVSFNAPIGGLIDSSQIINWPSDTSLIARVVAQLNAGAGGQFIFDHLYGQ